MTNRQMLSQLKKVQQLELHIKDIAYEIVRSTFDQKCIGIDSVVVGNTAVDVTYEVNCHGEYAHSSVNVPIEWFDEGYDYMHAFREMRRKEVEERLKAIEKERKRKAAAKKAAAAKRAKKEYETYLSLKKKFEPDEKLNQHTSERKKKNCNNCNNCKEA